jgi:hypothetical protein
MLDRCLEPSAFPPAGDDDAPSLLVELFCEFAAMSLRNWSLFIPKVNA